MKIEYDHLGVIQLDDFGSFSFDAELHFPDLPEGETVTISYRVIDDNGEAGPWSPLMNIHGTK